MPHTISAPDHPAWTAFLTFLHRAALAGQNGHTEAQSIWLEAAAHLQALDDLDLHPLIHALLDQRRHDDAIELAAIIAQLRPDDALAAFRFGYALQMANRHRDALAPYRRALAVNPDLPRLRNNLAGALAILREDAPEQVRLLESAVSVAPFESDAWVNLTQAHRFAMNLSRALQAGERALELAPDSPLALNNYALALKEAQRWQEAQHFAQRACDLAPNNAAMRSNLAILQLVRGDFEPGWAAHEARWHGSEELRGARPVFPKPQWQREPLAGKTLLVWGEQGMGDLLQCCRFIPLLAQCVHAQGGRLIWNSFPQMGALLERNLSRHVDGYSAGGGVGSLPHFDYEIALLSVPHVLRAGDNTLSETVPYLHPAPAARDAWIARLAGERGLKVGLAWTGSLGHQRNPFRRVGWERYAAAFRGMEGVTFYSLQPGSEADVSDAREAGLAIVDHSGEWKTFDDTAAFISALDLVITVCTSMAHLSGAIGQRTWVLLDTNPHWTWLLERRDTPWYPSATLYRQREFGEWNPVMAEVRDDLARLAAEGK